MKTIKHLTLKKYFILYDNTDSYRHILLFPMKIGSEINYYFGSVR